MFDMQEHLKNRNQFPAEELEKYAGRYVAWSADGTQIVASGNDLDELYDALDASKYDPAEVVTGRVPLTDEVILGGGIEL